jgi:hypothetical protein
MDQLGKGAVSVGGQGEGEAGRKLTKRQQARNRRFGKVRAQSGAHLLCH